MTIFHERTEDYPQDIDFDPFGPEQPRSKFRYSDEDTYQWAKGLGEVPQDHDNNDGDVKQLRDTSWAISRVRHRLRDRGGVNEAARAEFNALVQLAAAVEFASESYLHPLPDDMHPGVNDLIRSAIGQLQVAMHVRKHGVTEAGDGVLYEILKLPRSSEPPCNEFLQIEGSNT